MIPKSERPFVRFRVQVKPNKDVLPTKLIFLDQIKIILLLSYLFGAMFIVFVLKIAQILYIDLPELMKQNKVQHQAEEDTTEQKQPWEEAGAKPGLLRQFVLNDYVEAVDESGLQPSNNGSIVHSKGAASLSQLQDSFHRAKSGEVKQEGLLPPIKLEKDKGQFQELDEEKVEPA